MGNIPQEKDTKELVLPIIQVDPPERVEFKPKRQQVYLMEIAKITAALSYCDRRKVGCVLSDMSYETFVVGYNGGAKGGPNGCRRCKPRRCGCVHAEMNAIAKAPRGPKLAFVTCAPCEMCATLLVNSGVRKVYFNEEYLDKLGQKVFDEVGIPYYQI